MCRLQLKTSCIRQLQNGKFLVMTLPSKWCCDKRFEGFYCRMERPQKKFKHQKKVIINNQQMNVVANEKGIEREQKIIIYTPIFKGKP
jgi:hypothetical protein